jgi:hypothetical protein
MSQRNPYQKVMTDLMQVYPFNVECCPVPYEENMTRDEKFQALMEAFRRSRSLGSRVLQLANAFYVGQFLERKVSNNQRDFYVRQLSEYY